MDDHIVVHERGLRIECLHCHESYRGTLPVSITVWLAAAKAFGKQHAGCQPTEEQDDEHGV